MATLGEQIQGLLGSPAALNLGLGLLSQSGPSTTPIGFGQALAGAAQFASGREAQQLQLEAARKKLSDDKRRREAMNQLQGLFQPEMSPGPVVGQIGPAPIDTPGGQNQLMGLLGEISPQTFVQGLLAQQTQQPSRTSAAFNDFLATGGNPSDQASFLQFQQDRSGSDAQQQAELALLTARLTEQIRSTREETTTQAGTDNAIDQGITTGLESLRKMANLNERLTNTALETGLPLTDVRRAVAGGIQGIQQLFGQDTAVTRRLTSDFDSFKKFATDFTVESMERLSGAGTNFRLQSLIDSNANISASPETNALIIAGNIEELLQRADFRGITVPNRAELEELAKSLKQPFPENAPTTPGTIDFNDLGGTN